MRDCIRKWPIIEICFLVFVVLYIGSAWKNVTEAEDMKKPIERQIALTTIQGAGNASITGVSIILAAIAAVTGIRRDLDKKAKAHYRIAALLSVISLVFGIWNMGALPQLIRHNVAYDIWVAIPLIVQIWGLFLSGFRMLFGIFCTL